MEAAPGESTSFFSPVFGPQTMSWHPSGFCHLMARGTALAVPRAPAPCRSASRCWLGKSCPACVAVCPLWLSADILRLSPGCSRPSLLPARPLCLPRQPSLGFPSSCSCRNPHPGLPGEWARRPWLLRETWRGLVSAEEAILDGDTHFPFRNTLRWPAPAAGASRAGRLALWNENIPRLLLPSGWRRRAACSGPGLAHAAAVWLGWAASPCTGRHSWKMRLMSLLGTRCSLRPGSCLCQGAQCAQAPEPQRGASHLGAAGPFSPCGSRGLGPGTPALKMPPRGWPLSQR